MLRLTVELCPAGDDARRRVIGRAVIGRVGQDADGHRYVAALWHDLASDTRQVAVSHDREIGLWALVAAVTNAAAGPAGLPDAPARVFELARARLLETLDEKDVPCE